MEFSPGLDLLIVVTSRDPLSFVFPVNCYLDVEADKDLDFLVYLQTPSQVMACVLPSEACPVCLSPTLSCLHPLRIISQIRYLHFIIPTKFFISNTSLKEKFLLISYLPALKYESYKKAKINV